MEYQFSVVGHGYMRAFALSEGGAYEMLTMPAGAPLVAALLAQGGGKVAPCKAGSPVAVEHAGLVAARSGAMSMGGSAGWSAGGRDVQPEAAALVVAYDEGFGAMDPPKADKLLWASARRLPSRQQIEGAPKRCLVMLTADLLRNSGALISRQVSWERSATDLLWQLQNNPKFAHLRHVPEMLVLFSQDGALHVRSEEGRLRARLVLLSGGFEGELCERTGMNVPDAWAATVAAAAQAWAQSGFGEGEGATLDVGAVLRAGEAAIKAGYAPDMLRSGQFDAWMPIEPGACHGFDLPASGSEREGDPSFWCVASSIQGSRLQDMANNYVLHGAKVIEGIPRFSCGALTTIDRREIESFQNIRGLILAYAASKAVRPLSIAVFGAPGSGKSFGVTQIAKNVLPDVQKLEFNVSQMVGAGDLAAAFHRVRDAILEGKLPLVFFDEFDSDRDGRPLGWLKSFLMPMQDGKFKDDSGEHPIGKCVMVFAGGTSSSFERFAVPDDPQAFKNVKGPDFVSRLRGTIDVLGPNAVGKDDQNYLLRRAILLRSLLERKLGVKSGRMPVDKDVLHAMLMVPTYKHGARSMESILDMSRISGGAWDPASLPFRTQLSLHVDADAFMRLLLKDTVLGAYGERLARAIHEDFFAKRIHDDYAQKHGGAPNARKWEELPSEIKDSNRAQAESIPEKLLSIGCAFDDGDTPYPSVEAFTPEEIQRLAQDEHIRYVAQKTLQGWTYGEVRDEKAKKNPCLVEWETLPPEEQQKDIDTAENIIPLLRSVGLRVYRLV